MTHIRSVLALAAVIVLHGCTTPYTYSGKPQEDIGTRSERAAVGVDREASDMLGLEALDATISGDTSRGSRNEQAAALRAEAAALDRSAEETDLLAKTQERAAAKRAEQAKQARKAAMELLKMKRTGGEQAELRYRSAVRQAEFYLGEAQAARRVAKDLGYQAGTLRAKARVARKQAAKIERLAREPEYKAAKEPKYVGN